MSSMAIDSSSKYEIDYDLSQEILHNIKNPSRDELVCFDAQSRVFVGHLSLILVFTDDEVFGLGSIQLC